MFAGSDRLEDIAFYEPKVRFYTDNKIAVPGSNYGARLFQPRPGTNQIQGVVERLRAEPESRRASAVIWSPEDAVRTSNDIPCAFGVFYHIRGGALTATTTMRSNNAHLLVPYNFFEFSMLAEAVAVECNVPLGDYVHWAASMHLLDRERDQYMDVLDAGAGQSVEMPPMPNNPGPLHQANQLGQYEARLRMAGGARDVLQQYDQASEELHDYWRSLLGVLVVHKLLVIQDAGAAATVVDQMPEYLGPLVEQYVANYDRADRGRSPGQLAIMDLEDGLEPSRAVAATLTDSIDLRLLDERLLEICRDMDPPVSTNEWVAVQAAFREKAGQLVAARSDSRGADATDRYLPTSNQMVDFLRAHRSR
jgi:hypothetical protein